MVLLHAFHMTPVCLSHIFCCTWTGKFVDANLSCPRSGAILASLHNDGAYISSGSWLCTAYALLGLTIGFQLTFFILFCFGLVGKRDTTQHQSLLSVFSLRSTWTVSSDRITRGQEILLCTGERRQLHRHHRPHYQPVWWKAVSSSCYMLHFVYITSFGFVTLQA